MAGELEEVARSTSANSVTTTVPSGRPRAGEQRWPRRPATSRAGHRFSAWPSSRNQLDSSAKTFWAKRVCSPANSSLIAAARARAAGSSLAPSRTRSRWSRSTRRRVTRVQPEFVAPLVEGVKPGEHSRRAGPPVLRERPAAAPIGSRPRPAPGTFLRRPVRRTVGRGGPAARPDRSSATAVFVTVGGSGLAASASSSASCSAIASLSAGSKWSGRTAAKGGSPYGPSHGARSGLWSRSAEAIQGRYRADPYPGSMAARRVGVLPAPGFGDPAENCDPEGTGGSRRPTGDRLVRRSPGTQPRGAPGGRHPGR